jgi:very-short-patch-repair endonuclease
MASLARWATEWDWFRRQHPVAGFVVDFCAPQQKLIVELTVASTMNRSRERSMKSARKGFRTKATA